MERDLPYNGEKVDIFSLGAILFSLRVCSFGFISSDSEKGDKFYHDIKCKNYKLYWQEVGLKINGIKDLSKGFKDLYLSMVAFNPRDRPSIEEIYNHPWMRELKDEKIYAEYEKNLIKELQNREEIMNIKKEANSTS